MVLKLKSYLLRGKTGYSPIACNGCAGTGNCVLNDGLRKSLKKNPGHADGFIPAAPLTLELQRRYNGFALQRIGKVSSRK